MSLLALWFQRNRKACNLFPHEPVIPQYERSGTQVVSFELWLYFAGQSATSDRFRAARLMVPFGILTRGQLAHYTNAILVSKEEF
jgi:hypothetical protein